MNRILLVLMATLLVPLAAAQPSLQGEVMATSVVGEVLPFEGKGAFVGFFQGEGQPALGWSLGGESLSIVTSTYTVSQVGTVSTGQSGPDYNTQDYQGATVEPTLSTKPVANEHSFWMMVTPLQSDQKQGFHVQGSLHPAELKPADTVSYFNDAKHPAPETSASQDGSGVVNVRYVSQQPVLEWKPGSAEGTWTVTGNFVFTVYQADFQVTGQDGRTDHYSTGDDDPGFQVTNPKYDYKETRADITVHGGTLTLLPNGRTMQLDFADLAAPVQGGLDFVNAHGSVSLPSGDVPLAGQVHVDAAAVTLALAPRGGLVDAQFRGKVNGLAVDGQAVPIAPATTVSLAKAPPALVAGIVALFAVGGLAFTFLAVRKKTDPALLLARAQAFFEVGRYRAALRASRRLLRLQPTSVDAVTVAAMSLVRLGRPQQAKPLLERGLAAGGEHQGLLCMVEALVLFHQGNPRLAAQRLQEGFNTYPALHNELAAVDLLDQLLLAAEPSPSLVRQVVSP